MDTPEKVIVRSDALNGTCQIQMNAKQWVPVLARL